MLRALIDGTASLVEMAELARGRLRSKRAELALALRGRVEAYHRFLLTMQLNHVEVMEKELEQLDQYVARKRAPYDNEMMLLKQIPGVDMSVFASVHHLAVWAGVCPSSHESAGKKKSVRARKGNRHLRTILVGAAMSAAHTKGTHLKDKYHRLKARRGAMRAALAIAHKILVTANHMLARRTGYQDLGEAYLDQIDQTRTAANLKRRLERLGYEVSIAPKPPAAAANQSAAAA
jgi:transposase